MAFKDTPEPYLVPAPHRPTEIEFLATESPQEFADLRALWAAEKKTPVSSSRKIENTDQCRSEFVSKQPTNADGD